MADTPGGADLKDSTAPLEASERAAIARLLEAARDALGDKRLHLLDRIEVADHLVNVLDGAALDVRRGWRQGRLDAAVGELDRLVQRLADAAQAPEHNAADPFTVETPHRPITNSGP
jgi:hypothetical protein